MSSKLNKASFERLIGENITWLKRNTKRSLEQDHIITCLRESVNYHYPGQTFEHLEGLIFEWAEERGILTGSGPKSQLLKTLAELGELADAVNKNNREEIVDGLGDVLVTLIILNRLVFGEFTSLTASLEIAYDEIKNRKGSMQNGIFVKAV